MLVCLSSFFLNISMKNLTIFYTLNKKFLPNVFDWRFSLLNWLKIDSAASIPLFIAVWVPLILGTFMKPGLQPISKPPGNVSFGIDWKEIFRVHLLVQMKPAKQHSMLQCPKVF